MQVLLVILIILIILALIVLALTLGDIRRYKRMRKM